MGLYLPCLFVNGRAKQTIMERRNCLKTDSVECVECLHHGLGSGLVSVVSTDRNSQEIIIVDD